MRQFLSVLSVAVFASTFSIAPLRAQTGQTPNPPAAPEQAQKDQQGPRPGGVRISTPPPDRDKWFVKVVSNTQRNYICRPLSCPDDAHVVINFEPSPTRSPDAQALDKLAKEIPRSMERDAPAIDIIAGGTAARKVQTFVSAATQLKGYPAVVTEMKLTQNNKSSFVATASIFVKGTLMRLVAVSPTREVAKKVLDDFVTAATIVEGSPVPPGQRPGQLPGQQPRQQPPFSSPPAARPIPNNQI